MTSVSIDVSYNNTLTAEGYFKIIKFTTSADSLPNTINIGSAGSGKTWLNLGGSSANGTALNFSISGYTATIVSGAGTSEVCNIRVSKY